jgi:hypothetical protein
MTSKKTVHEPNAQLMSADDVIADADRLKAALCKKAMSSEPSVALKIPLATFLDALEGFSENELLLVKQRLDGKLRAK